MANISELVTSDQKVDSILSIIKESLHTSPQNLTKNKNIIIGLIELLGGNYEKSTRLLQAAYEFDNSDDLSLFLLVDSLIRQNEFAAAKNICEQAEKDTKAMVFGKLLKSHVLSSDNDEVVNQEIKYKVLFVQDAPSYRNYKYAKMLKAAGHKVGLCYTKSNIREKYALVDENSYTKTFNVGSYQDIWKIAGEYDLIHSFNFPDLLTVSSIAGDKPVVHDTSELLSLKDQNSNYKYFESIAIKGSAGRIFSSDFQLSLAKQLYGKLSNSTVIHNYPLKSDFPKKRVEKLSVKDGKTHIVFSGRLAALNMKNKELYLSFINLSRHGVFVHIIPENYLPESANFFAPYKNIFYNQPLKQAELTEKLTQYDCGLIPMVTNVKKNSSVSTIPNKMFQYLSAGLPVAAPSYQVYREYFQSENVGVCYDSTEDLVKKVSIIKGINRKKEVSKGVKSLEDELPGLLNIYKKVIMQHV